MDSDQHVLPLTVSVLDQLSMAVPRYDRAALRRSIVHLGVGGFHRSHLATYIDQLCRLGHTDWSIVGAGVLPGDSAMADALGAQDHLYTLIIRGADETSIEVIGSIVDYIHAVPSPDRLIDAIAAADTQLVSLTVTEGGYPVDDLTGDFLPDDPSARPGSAFALLAAGLERRRNHGGSPITVMSCDNVIHNGAVTRASTLGAAAAIGPELVDWIERSIAFPNSMVDRITPATTDADRDWLSEHHRLIDRWPVVTEPFRQWVVEDRFGGARLPLEELDVIVTNDVEPYELMKLRLLNAGHSSLAYLAALDGRTTVDEAMAAEHLCRFVVGFLDHEAKPVVPPVAGIDLDEYTASVVERFSNPHIGDQISRLCLDGSAKFPKFLLPTVRSQLDAGGPVVLSALALAGWCHYLNGTTDAGDAITHANDPQLEDAIAHARRSQSDPAAFLAWGDVFGADLAVPGRFADAFVEALDRLRSTGVPSAIDAALQEVAGPNGRSND